MFDHHASLVARRLLVLKPLLYVQCTVCVKELITLMIFYIYIVQFNTSKHKSYQILWNNRRTTLHQ